MLQMVELWSGFLALGVVFALGWRWSVRQQNAGIVDALWAFTLGGLVVWFALMSEGDVARRILFALMTSAWSLRLGFHIFGRLREEKTEDKRYAFLREHWGAQADRNFFFFFQSQALANLALSFPIWLLMRQSNPLGIFDLWAVLIILVAVLGEWAADRQLSQWRSKAENTGKTCRKGLWAYSRHPNYFFEWLHWLAYPVAGFNLLGDGHGLLWICTWFAPVAMLLLLLRFTGIPYTEKQALRSRGDDYRRYQNEVSSFIPWFPKKRKNS